MGFPAFNDPELERRVQVIRERRGDRTFTATVRALLREKIAADEAVERMGANANAQQIQAVSLNDDEGEAA